MDRYLEIYHRLPNTKRPNHSIEAMKFIKSLLQNARDEVTSSSKKNKRHEAETYLPATLFELFKYLEKNIGDIQEAFYLAVTTPAMVNNKTFSNVEGFDTKKRNFTGNNAEETSKKFKENHNLCSYCKKATYTYEHLKSCVEYLKSEKYKNYVIRAASKKEYGNKMINIFYNNIDENINTIPNYSEVYDMIIEDIEAVYLELKPI